MVGCWSEAEISIAKHERIGSWMVIELYNFETCNRNLKPEFIQNDNVNT